MFQIVDTHWHEVAQALPDLEALAEDVDEDDSVRQLAASVASRVFFYLEEPSQALRLALEASGIFDGHVREGATDSEKAYVECLVGAAVDAYVMKKQREHEEAGVGLSAGASDAKEDEVVSALPMDKLHKVVQAMLEKCYKEDKFEHALGVALEAREMGKVEEILNQCAAQYRNHDYAKLYKLLQFAYDAATTLVSSKAFRFEVMLVLVNHLDRLFCPSVRHYRRPKEGEVPVPLDIQTSSAFTLANVYQVLRKAHPVARIIADLLHGTEDEALLGLQLCFDLVDSGDSNFVMDVNDSLVNDNHEPEENSDYDSNYDACADKYEKAYKVLNSGFPSELAIAFLHKNSDSDPLIMEHLKQALEQRGAGRNSVLHNCAVVTHSYLNAGTTNDSFLRDNLEWMKKASNWAKFSATASLGVVHAGHVTEAMTLLEPYLPQGGEDNAPAPVQTTGGYAEGGSLYALGLIHGSHDGIEYERRLATNHYLLNHLRHSHVNEPISHGAALGVGLTAIGANDVNILNELKELIYTDSAVGGEAAGIAIGLVFVGSGAGNVQNDVESVDKNAVNEIISELKGYARETQHEKIIRGIVMGIALINYGQEENADVVIDEMRADRDPLFRYGAQYALALAYCGTGSNKAIRLLLHTAVSDVSDDVRMAAVIGLAFVLYKTPHRVPQLVKLLLESFNPHVRYASCMAVGIAMAGSGDDDSIALLEPMLNDMSDFVRQGALIGTSLIYMQQGDHCNGRKIKTFREKLASLLTDKHQTTLTKMGAILSTGIIDAGGRNCSFDLGSKNGFTRMTSAIGAALWLQHWYWFPMMHMFSLAITPTYTIGLNMDFKFPKGFEIQCNAKPSQFAYPKRLEEKKEEKKKRVETVTLSTTAKNKARLARKKAKEEEEDDENVKMEEAKDGEEAKPDAAEESKDDKMDVDGADIDAAEEEKKTKKKREPEPISHRLSNPCRITKAQAEFCAFDLEQRYRPIRVEEKPCGVILLTDSAPGEEEDLGTVKAPSIETEDEADPPEPFEWTPMDHPDANSGANTETSSSAAPASPSEE